MFRMRKVIVEQRSEDQNQKTGTIHRNRYQEVEGLCLRMPNHVPGKTNNLHTRA